MRMWVEVADLINHLLSDRGGQLALISLISACKCNRLLMFFAVIYEVLIWIYWANGAMYHSGWIGGSERKKKKEQKNSQSQWKECLVWPYIVFLADPGAQGEFPLLLPLWWHRPVFQPPVHSFKSAIEAGCSRAWHSEWGQQILWFLSSFFFPTASCLSQFPISSISLSKVFYFSVTMTTAVAFKCQYQIYLCIFLLLPQKHMHTGTNPKSMNTLWITVKDGVICSCC